MRGKIGALCCLMVVLLVFAGSVAGHGDLVAAEPVPGAQLAESPAEIRLTFSEPVSPTSRIALMGENFEPVEGLVPQFNPAEPGQLYTPLPTLTPGVYTVQWVSASADGHEISGSYSFSVGLVTPGAPGDESGGEGAEQTVSRTGVGVSRWVLVLVALAVLVPVALVALRRGKRGAVKPPAGTGE